MPDSSILHYSCESDHEVAVTSFSFHKLNLVGCPRNYFTSPNCSFVFIIKDKVCKHCKFLQTALNISVGKICIEKALLPKNFQIEKIDSYLTRKLRADPIFYFSKKENMVKSSIDSTEWGDFL